jgi:hypothetical protein
MTEQGTAITIVHRVVDQVKATIRNNEIDVLIVDPFVTTHGVSENDNNKMTAVAKIWAQIADDENCAVQIVHHVRKSDGRREVSVDDLRGGGALANAARAVRLLIPMSVKEAKKLTIARDDRFQYFRVVNGKSNLSMRSERSEWRQIVSFSMNNGEGNLGPQDHVGVVVPWQWSSAASLVEDVADNALDAIKTRIAEGSYREHFAASDWAGNIVAEVLDIDLSDSNERRRVGQMLKAWIADDHFEVVLRRNDKREEKKFIVVKEAAALPHLDS